jgi:hypothetical protein
MSFYSKLAETSRALLGRFGQDVVLRRHTSTGEYNPDTGATEQDHSDTVYKGALFDFQAGQTDINNSLIQAGDKELLLEDTGVPPSVSDQVLIGGVLWSIQSVGEINPAGTPVLYKLQVRR